MVFQRSRQTEEEAPRVWVLATRKENSEFVSTKDIGRYLQIN